MSLESLLSLRKQGHAPTAVWVIVGDAPAWLPDTPDCIVVKPGQTPERMDWRPVVGMHVDLFELGNHSGLMDRVGSAVEAAQARSCGIACRDGAFGTNPAHEQVLKRIFRTLTQ